MCACHVFEQGGQRDVPANPKGLPFNTPSALKHTDARRGRRLPRGGTPLQPREVLQLCRHVVLPPRALLLMPLQLPHQRATRRPTAGRSRRRLPITPHPPR
jgi:hypothetical protein